MNKLLKSVVTVLVTLVAGGALLIGAQNVWPNLSPLQTTSASRDTQIVNAIERKEQVVLLSLSIQGISERTAGSKFFGIDIPGSNRASFLQYNFNAKLGLEGKDVKIERTGESQYRMSMPAFTFIGHDNVSFKLAAENNGVLSWATPQIDPVETINQILNDDAKSQYVTANQQILTDQAKSFYTGIIRSVDPSAEVTFDFSK
jgi:hypothetical protein